MFEGLLRPLSGFLSSLSANDWVDIGCAVVALFSIGVGACRGFSAELPIGVGWFCGLLTAWYTYAPMHAFYREQLCLESQSGLLLLLTALTVVLLAWGVAVLVSRGLRLLATKVEKTPTDHILGAMLGAIRAFFLLLFATTIMLSQSWFQDAREVFCDQSRTGAWFTPLASHLLATIEEMKPHLAAHRRTDDPGDEIVHPPPKNAHPPRLK